MAPTTPAERPRTTIGVAIPTIDPREGSRVPPAPGIPPTAPRAPPGAAVTLPSPESAESLFLSAQASYAAADHAAAVSQARAAAAGGHAEAAALAGFLTERGMGTPADDRAAVALYLQAARAAEPNALAALGRLALESRGGLRASESSGWLERAVAAGRGDAALLQGRALFDGRLPRDPAAALAAFRRALELGEAEGALEAAVLLDDGEAVPADDPVAARALMQRAAEAGVPGAAGGYGLLVYTGRGGSRDLAEAARWMFRGAEEGDGEAQFLFALMLSRGEGVARDLERAYGWAIRAADAPDAGEDPDRARLRDALARALPAEARSRAQAAAATR